MSSCNCPITGLKNLFCGPSLRVSRLAGSPLFDGSPAGPYKHFDRTNRACVSSVSSSEGVTLLVIQTLTKVDSTGKVTLFPATTFLHIKGVL